MKMLGMIGAVFAVLVPTVAVVWFAFEVRALAAEAQEIAIETKTDAEVLKENQRQLQEIHIQQAADEKATRNSNRILCSVGELPEKWCKAEGFAYDEGEG